LPLPQKQHVAQISPAGHHTKWTSYNCLSITLCMGTILPGGP